MGSKVFRVEEDFVAQVGDVTRGDGSGGESICESELELKIERDASRLIADFCFINRRRNVQRRERGVQDQISARNRGNGIGKQQE